jgi:tetratricopeptide (TPR) repeat protein
VRAATLRTRVRRLVARTIVSRPAYRAFIQLPTTSTLVARAAFRTGRDHILRQALHRLERHRPDSVSPLLLRADLLTFEGRYEEALTVAERAAQLDPASPAAAARVVKLSDRACDQESTTRVVESAVTRFPRSVEVMWQVAMSCRSAERYGRIAHHWQQATAVPTDLPRVVRQLTSAAARAEQLDAAVEWYRRATTVLLDSTGPVPRPVVTRLAGLGARGALRDLCHALEGAGIPYFLVAGTALGLVREGGPLGADQDLDVGVFDADWDRDRLIALFTGDPRFDLDLHPQTQRVSLRHRGGSPIDVFRFYEEGGRVWHDGVFVRWHNTPFEVARRRIGGLDLPLPADIERYLVECYGEWRTPYPGFDAFTDDAPNVEVTWPEYHRLHLVRRGYERLATGDHAGAVSEFRRAGEVALAESVGRRR